MTSAGENAYDRRPELVAATLEVTAGSCEPTKLAKPEKSCKSNSSSPTAPPTCSATNTKDTSSRHGSKDSHLTHSLNDFRFPDNGDASPVVSGTKTLNPNTKRDGDVNFNLNLATPSMNISLSDTPNSSTSPHIELAPLPTINAIHVPAVGLKIRKTPTPISSTKSKHSTLRSIRRFPGKVVKRIRRLVVRLTRRHRDRKHFMKEKVKHRKHKEKCKDKCKGRCEEKCKDECKCKHQEKHHKDKPKGKPKHDKVPKKPKLPKEPKPLKEPKPRRKDDKPHGKDKGKDKPHHKDDKPKDDKPKDDKPKDDKPKDDKPHGKHKEKDKPHHKDDKSPKEHRPHCKDEKPKDGKPYCNNKEKDKPHCKDDKPKCDAEDKSTCKDKEKAVLEVGFSFP